LLTECTQCGKSVALEANEERRRLTEIQERSCLKTLPFSPHKPCRHLHANGGEAQPLQEAPSFRAQMSPL